MEPRAILLNPFTVCLRRNKWNGDVYTWLDPQRTSYSFGYGSLWSLAELVHPPARIIAFALPSGAEPGPGMCRHIVHNISEGGRLRHQVPSMGVVKHQNKFAPLLHLGMGGPRLPSFTL